MRNDAAGIFFAGITAVDPKDAVKRFVRRKKDLLMVGDTNYNLKEFNRIRVIGAGKAAAPMALAVEELLGDLGPEGLITVKYNHIEKLGYIEILEAGHPLPDENGVKGAERILGIAHSAGPDDLVICLISGGGSALLPLPAPPVSLKDKQKTLGILLSCGATIHEINAIRKHLSLIKGGRLARAAFPARLITLILSDVVGDDLDVIASGPTVFDDSTFSDCLCIMDQYDIAKEMPETVMAHLEKGRDGFLPETPKKREPFFQNTQNLIIGNNSDALAAARKKALELGYNTLILSSLIDGDTVQAAKFHSAVAKEILKTGNPLKPPACILSGGETTVHVRGNGMGGRNMEFALAAAHELEGWENIIVLSAGTDGSDGPTNSAGAVTDPFTLKRAGSLGLDTRQYLINNDSYSFFKELGDLMITGPTKTNVMDIRIILVS
jgi:glycerate 2-kinase